MNIGIITVNNSHNYGSYLQANSLHKVLSKYGDVFLIDTNTRNMKNSYKGRIKSLYKTTKNPLKIIQGSVFETTEYTMISNLWKRLGEQKAVFFDLLVIGSDEIWNITRKACQFDIFWGEGFSCKKISYAPSVNNADSESFRGSKYLSYLNHFKHVSVRDVHSKEVLQEFCSKDITVVLDPTLLQKPDSDNWVPDYPYIAVYLLTDIMKKDEIEGIIAFARKTGLKLVSAGRYLPWCDKCVHSIHGNPFHIYQNAKYVITNSFHGTAFAINYNKNFVSFGNKNLKIRELTRQFGIQEKAIEKASQISEQLRVGIDYDKVNLLLSKQRESSIRYLDSSILGC